MRADNESSLKNGLDETDRIFRNEMEEIFRAGLISDEEYKKIMGAHDAFRDDRATRLLQESLSGAGHGYEGTEEEVVKKIKPSTAVKREVTPQEIRDRNITLVLILGVIFVLTAGVVFATTNWGSLASSVKTSLVAIVTLMFFGVSIAAEKALRIDKTAFAFWSLGVLFVPVTVLAAGYFQLFGGWLSLTGEGRFLLGVIGATCSIAIFAFSTYRYTNRFYAWLTLIACSIDVVFAMAALSLGTDMFYMGIVIYNSVLVAVYASGRLTALLKLFIGEMGAFIPVNLVISTLFMLVFFEDPSMYGVNLILISAIYAFMVFSRWRKEYAYAFSTLLVYGIYRLVESTPLASADTVIFAICAFIFAGLEYLSSDREALRRIFAYAGGIASMSVFLYANYMGMAIFSDEPSVTVLASFILISLNYFYLANRVENKVFSYLAPVFVMASGEQAYLLIRPLFDGYIYSAHLLVISAVMFTLLYFFNDWRYTRASAKASGVVSLVVMFYSYIQATAYGNHVTAVISLFTFIAALWIFRSGVVNSEARSFMTWAIPVSLA